MQDSTVQIKYKYLVAANQAYIQLRYYKKVEGLTQERLHNKDISIQYYERVYSKCKQEDSINTLIITNLNTQLSTAFQLYKDEKKAKNIQKVKTVLLSTILPIITGLGGFAIGHYFFH